MKKSTPAKSVGDVAIIGMAGRFPGAANVEMFWQNLKNGVESVTFFTDEELAAAGVDAELLKSPNYVKARPVLNGVELFDANFFGYSPREAETMDPQHRVFLETAWEALENAGYDSERFDGAIAVYGGLFLETYLLANLSSRPGFIEDFLMEKTPEGYQTYLGNDKDFLTSRVAYKLNLRGPAVTVQTGCSTSLVAACQACASLLSYQSDMALAGGVTIVFPQKKGYLYEEGGMASPDGHCRPFDARAQGTTFGSGVGMVVLKRLEDALADGDHIHAVIKGSALNNDGGVKVSYTAPSVDGQAEVIALAQALAGVSADKISYIEAHGTATPLGDPIEVAALTQAFRQSTDKKGFCAIGSVKSNIGHLDAAAGVTGLIKTALALEHKLIPPSLHFTQPNPQIDFANSPFYVNAKLIEWKTVDEQRRAGVSSFGVGGTNAHVVVEESSPVVPPGPSRPWQLLLLSAKTSSALDRATANLAGHLKKNPAQNLADAAYTLQVGRRAFNHRRMLVCHDVNDAVAALEKPDTKRVFTQSSERRDLPVVFMFPGQGAQYVNMGVELYRSETVFREAMNRCAELLQPHLGLDLRTVLYPGEGKIESAQQQLTQTRITQPALFAIEYSLAQLWMSWGVRPAAMIGHSVGEYVAGCLAEVFPLEDALALVAGRARLVQEQPPGAMLAVRLPEKELRPLLDAQVSIAAINAPSLCVASGPHDAIEALERRLKDIGVASVRLQTSHASHSAMMDPAVAPLAALLKKVTFQAPQIPYVSNVTGQWITAAEATDPDFWAGHVRQPVRFADGVGELLKGVQYVLLEVGPGQTLSTLARQHPAKDPKQVVLSSLSPTKDQELRSVLTALGQFWLAGGSVDWQGFYRNEKRQRVPLPTYPFERKRYWVEPVKRAARVKLEEKINPEERADVAELAGPAEKSSVVTTGRDGLIPELKKLFESLSGRDLADVDDSTTFVAMGFDSLFFMQASWAIEKRFRTRIAFRQFQEEYSTFAALAAHLVATTKSPVQIAPVETPSAAAEPATARVVPLTEAQREIWFSTRLGEDASCAFNESCLLHLRGRFSEVAMRTAIQGVIARHDALRTTFSPMGDQQKIAPELTIEIQLVDQSGLEPKELEAWLDARLTAEAAKPFDLENGPPLRAEIVKLAEEHHVLLLTDHHIVCDGRSQAVLIYELGELYSAACQGTSCTLPPVRQYSAFAQEQVRIQQTPEWAAAEAFWRKQFTEGVPVFELPGDRPRPPLRTYSGGRHCVVVNTKVWQELKRVSARHGCTLFTTLLASYYAFLHRLTGQSDLVVGVPTAGPAIDASDNLIGHCVNFLPVRVRLADNPTFAAHLTGAKQIFLDAIEYHQCTLGSLMQKLNLARDPSQPSLVSLVFNFGRVQHPLKFYGLEAEFAVNPKCNTSFDLGVEVRERESQLEMEFYYRTDLFDAETIHRWMGHFQTYLEGVAGNPHQRLDELSLLTAAEQRQLLAGWNDTEADYPRGQWIHQLFEAQVERSPDAVALVCGEERLTYRELNRRANQLAHHLQSLGVGPEVLVGICVERTAAMMVGLLGVLKAGGGYVPLDPKYPQERLALILEDTTAPVLLTQQRLLGTLPKHGAKVVCLDSDWASVADASEDNSVTRVTDSNIAYVIYTSGSTGRPKGVVIEHRNTVAFLHWAGSVFSQEEIAGVLAGTSICFDLSVFELFFTLSRGGKVILAENAMQLPELPAVGEVTLINTVPSAITQLLRLGNLPPSVQTVNLAGEPLQTALVQQIYEHSAVKKVYDLYGPSETTTYSTVALRSAQGRATIGKPITNTEIYLLDAHCQPVPIGVPGEMYIGGDGVARGYLKRPELTTEKFISHPFSTTNGARLYKTGDLARFLPDGNIEFLGRIDNQVKIRGFRIELGEIEAVLGQHPGVKETVVVAREDQTGDKRLIAYVVAARAGTLTSSDLRAFLKEKLPEYMVPAFFVRLDALPLSPNGKVNRAALPSPDLGGIGSEKKYVPPGDSLEVQLAGIWEKVLGVHPIGIKDNFYDLGGHSLLAVRLFAQIDKILGKKLPFVTLFEAPTIKQMATILRNQGWQPRWSSLVAIQPGGSKPPLFCVPPDDGTVLIFADLARHLGKDQPLYGLEPVQMWGKERVAYYVDQIQAFQPQGPVLFVRSLWRRFDCFANGPAINGARRKSRVVGASRYRISSRLQAASISWGSPLGVSFAPPSRLPFRAAQHLVHASSQDIRPQTQV